MNEDYDTAEVYTWKEVRKEMGGDERAKSSGGRGKDFYFVIFFTDKYF